MKELNNFKGMVMVIRGLPGKEQSLPAKGNMIFKNHLPAREVEEAFNKSELIISRSGYTTVMDICKLQKKAVLIPTPGQTEQEYLAIHLQTQGWCTSLLQNKFTLEELLIKRNNFGFNLPQLNMEAYKNVVNNFVKKLNA